MHPSKHTSRIAFAFALPISTPFAGLAATTNATLIGRTTASEPIQLALYLPSRDPAGAHEFAIHVTKPGDPLYRHFPTPVEFASASAPTRQTFKLSSSGRSVISRCLTVGERSAAGNVLPISGPTGAMQAALGVTFDD